MNRPSRPHRRPTRTPAEVERRAVALRLAERRGQDWLGPELGLPARTVSRILRRHGLPYLCECDPLTGNLIRASKGAVRYERDRPGELVHMDVKDRQDPRWRRLARWRVAQGSKKPRKEGPQRLRLRPLRGRRSLRLAYSEILPDEKGATCAAFLARAAAYSPATASPTSNGS